MAAEHRFCARCGSAVADTAPGAEAAARTIERTPAAPAPPPPGTPPPSAPPPAAPPASPQSPRYPLFADEVGDHTALPIRVNPAVTPPAPRHETQEPPLRAHDPLPETSAAAPPSGARAAVPWLVGALALLLVASLGALLMLRGGDGDQVADGSDDVSLDVESSAETPPVSKPPSPPSTTPPAQSKPDKAVELAGSASVLVPAVAPPNQDVEGNPVRYDGENMLDGDPTTAWRMPDSAAGETVVLQLPGPTRLTDVGIVNGYAKSSGPLDWYEGNRRIREAIWVFDGGEEITQELDDVRALQTLRLKPVVTSSVTIRITRVSTPGEGPAARNYTAISEVSLVGSPTS